MTQLKYTFQIFVVFYCRIEEELAIGSIPSILGVVWFDNICPVNFQSLKNFCIVFPINFKPLL